MILPILAYGHPVLKKEAVEIDSKYKGIEDLIDNMFETMYESNGVGLAAPQIGKSIRLFIIDSEKMEDDPKKSVKEVFINPVIHYNEENFMLYEEGCLSIPHIREDIERPESIKISYRDRNFKKHTKVFNGLTARVIQHEFDHLDGILFTDLITPLRKRLLKKRLDKIAKGDVKVDYPMIFPALMKKSKKR